MTPSTREPTIEIAHESLLRSWPRLRAWLAEDRDFIGRLQHVGTAAAAWAAAGRPESELYRGARLDAASEGLATRPGQFTDLEREFVEASRAAAVAAQERDRRARRRLRRGFVATSVALVVALVAGSVAFVQRRNATTQADAADVARLVALSQSLTGTKRDVAMLLAHRGGTPRSGRCDHWCAAVGVVLRPDLPRIPARRDRRSAGALAFSPDGRYLYSTSQDLTATHRCASSSRPIARNRCRCPDSTPRPG